MGKPKLIRITTIPLSLDKLLEGQLSFMKSYFEVVAVSSDKDQLTAYAQKERVPYFFLDLTRKITPLRDILGVCKLYAFFKKEKPQIVHTHTPKAGIIGMMAAWFAGVPNRLHTVAGLPLLEEKGVKKCLLKFVEKATFKMATNVYPNSAGLLDIIVSEGLCRPEKMKVLAQGSSNGIDTSYFKLEQFSNDQIAALKDCHNIPSDDFVFIFVGRIVKDKGIDELVCAFGKLTEKYKNCTLLLVGAFEDDLDPVHKKTRVEIAQNPKIISCGYQNDVRIYFAISNALVFPSYREGFPNVVMQACAMSLPCIVSDINGCNEIIIHERNGLIVAPKSVDMLVDAMERIMDDGDLMNLCKSNARKMIIARYEQQEVWEALLNEYKRLLPNL